MTGANQFDSLSSDLKNNGKRELYGVTHGNGRELLQNSHLQPNIEAFHRDLIGARVKAIRRNATS